MGRNLSRILLVTAASAAAMFVRPSPIVAQEFRAPEPKTAVGKLGQIEWDGATALDDLDDALDRCDTNAIAKLIPELDSLAARARDLAAVARKQAQFSTIDPAEPERVAADLQQGAGEARWALQYCARSAPLRLFPQIAEPLAPPNAVPGPPGKTIIEPDKLHLVGPSNAQFMAERDLEKAKDLQKAYQDAASRCDRDRMDEIKRELAILGLRTDLNFAPPEALETLKQIKAIIDAVWAMPLANCPQPHAPQPYHGPYSPPVGPSAVGPNLPLGGPMAGHYCTENQRREALLRLEEEMLKTDSSTAAGRARYDELRREYLRTRDTKLEQCGPQAVPQPERPLPKINLPLGEPPQEQPPQERKRQEPRNRSILSPLRIGPVQIERGNPGANGGRGPTTPLGGAAPGTYCNEQQRIEELQRLQEQLINTDSSTPQGRRQAEQIQGEIQRVKNAKVQRCGSSERG